MHNKFITYDLHSRQYNMLNGSVKIVKNIIGADISGDTHYLKIDNSTNLVVMNNWVSWKICK